MNRGSSGTSNPCFGQRVFRISVLYDPRHTAAKLALYFIRRVSPKIVTEQLGQASVAFTLEVNSHVLSHMQNTAAMKVEALLMDA